MMVIESFLPFFEYEKSPPKQMAKQTNKHPSTNVRDLDAQQKKEQQL